jgi:protease-4
MDKIGIENQTLTSGPYKDAGSPLRRMTDGEREQLTAILDSLHARFIDVVREGRPDLTVDQVQALADGRIFSARQAEANGLVDVIGDLPGAVELAEEQAGIDRSRVVAYARPQEWRENLYSMSAAPLPTVSPWALFDPVSEPSFLYLWWPGARYR